MISQYLNLIFDPENVVHVGCRYDVSKRSTLLHVSQAAQHALQLPATVDGQYISINPLGPDGKSTCYQTFLFEIDNGWSIERQMEFYFSLGLPFTSAVFTGGKSVHILIRMTQPVKDLETYKRLHKAIWHALDCVPDPSSDAGKTTKVPGGKRLIINKMHEQTLLALHGRVTPKVLHGWLKSRGALHHMQPQPVSKKRSKSPFSVIRAKAVKYAVQYSGRDYGQVYVDCPACGGRDKLTVNLDDGRFHCFKECHWQEISRAFG